MKRSFVYLSAFAAVATGFTACDKKDQQITETGIRPRIEYSSLSTSSNYLEIFKDKQGNQTVDFSGQTTRQDMLAEMDSVMRIPTGFYVSKGVQAAAVNASVLKNMYAHSGSPFRQASLNAATDKQLKGKTAASFTSVDAEAERARFEGWMDKFAQVSASYDKVAADGQAGIAVNNTSKYLVDEKGIEYSQLIQKGLIGAVMLDQLANVYLGAEKMNVDNKNIVSGKAYTQMEHHWDEAYGYMTKNGTFPLRVNGAAQERYLGGYLRQVADSSNFFLAFLKGRAAIGNADYGTRDQQITFIRNAAEKAVAMVAVSYLNKTLKQISSSPAAAMHAYAEGLGFIYSLRYAHNAKVNKAKSDEYMNKLMTGKGFYSLTPTVINEVKKGIADTFGFPETYETSH